VEKLEACRNWEQIFLSRRPIAHVVVGQVDNALVDLALPLLKLAITGCHILSSWGESVNIYRLRWGTDRCRWRMEQQWTWMCDALTLSPLSRNNHEWTNTTLKHHDLET
jgi:hypothetical protein